MRKFVAATSISRQHLLKGKVKAFKKLISDFMQHRQVRFATPYGRQKIQELLAQYSITNDDDSILSFVESIGGENIGIICYQVDDDDYEFALVSGSKDELLRMMKGEQRYASPNRNAHVSIE